MAVPQPPPLRPLPIGSHLARLTEISRCSRQVKEGCGTGNVCQLSAGSFFHFKRAPAIPFAACFFGPNLSSLSPYTFSRPACPLENNGVVCLRLFLPRNRDSPNGNRRRLLQQKADRWQGNRPKRLIGFSPFPLRFWPAKIAPTASPRALLSRFPLPLNRCVRSRERPFVSASVKATAIPIGRITRQ